MKCPQCQFENPAHIRFCGNCGEQLFQSEEQTLSSTKTLKTPLIGLDIGTLFAGRYHIIEELGRGGMGKVYKVFDKELKEKMALKLLRPEIAADEKMTERFRNELKFARKITHKNICRMYDFNKDLENSYITMEYVSGEDLKSSVTRMGPLSAGKTVFLARQICEGLAEAHKLGVIHRDLKPQNIMIDRAGNIRIMDFGIARSAQAKGVTATGMMIGTPEYMAPEQVEGKDVDQRADIYSLGVILFELLTGTVPFEGDTPITVAIKHLKDEAPEPKTLNATVPDDMNKVVLKCLEKDRTKRYASVEELLSELDKIEKGVPITDRIIPDKKPTPVGETSFLGGYIREKPQIKKYLIPVFAVIAVGILAIALIKLLPLQKSSESLLPPPPPPLQEGKLVVNSVPSEAAVYIDGNQLGITPVTSPLSPGKHSLRIEKSGYEEITEEIEIVSAQTVEKKYTLARIQTKPQLTRKLNVKISTIPSPANIYINDLFVSNSPFSGEYERGRYTIRIEKQGYSSIEEEIDLRSNFSKMYRLKRTYGWFSISAHPYAEVEIDGKPIGKPGERVPPVKVVRVTSGPHRIKFILKDYSAQEITAEREESVQPEETKRVHHKFENLPAPGTQTEKEESPAEEAGKGWLVINAFPYAQIEIDGKSYREVPPVLKVKLTAGKHIVKFIASRLNQTHTMEVTIAKGEQKEIRHKFD
ncbi:MAG: protein kinase [Candidatus Aminicenantes bacterium]|jgi:serine/threonine protein kinase